MTDEQHRVRSDSDELLDALRQLKETELRKRRATISTDEFHRLAREVQRRAGDVWHIADDEVRDGETAPSTGATIQSVDPLDEPED